MTMTENEQIFEELCRDRYPGGYDAWRREWFDEWAKWEGTAARFNPLATTNHWGKSTQFNSADVQNFATIADGVAALAATLDPHGEGLPGWVDHFPTIRQVITNQTMTENERWRVVAELQKWGTMGFAQVIAAGWMPSAVANAPDPDAAALQPWEARNESGERISLQSVYDYVNALNTVVTSLAESANVIRERVEGTATGREVAALAATVSELAKAYNGLAKSFDASPPTKG